jgi:1,4-alpha-glucan branching enzyme
MAKKKSVVANQGTKDRANQRLERKYSTDKSICVVTFWLPKEAAPETDHVVVAGTFNNWDQNSHPMKKLGNGDFALEVTLEAGKEHEFRFIIDKIHWENAWNADKYVKSACGDFANSVIVT